MISSRYDVMTARSYTDAQGNERTAWTRIGTLWPLRDKEGFSLTLDALPLPGLNKQGALECRAVCFPPKERDEEAPQRSKPQGGKPPSDLDSEIPFAPDR